MTDALLRLVSADERARPVAVARVMVGLAAALEAVSAVTSRRLDRVLRPGVLEAPRLDWLPRLSRTGGWVLLLVWLTAALLFAAGWRTRATGAVLVASLATYLVLDEQLFANHVYLLALLTLLLVLANSGAALSVDAARGRARRRVPRWPVFLLTAQVAIVYGYAAISKLNGDWLRGVVLDSTMNRIGWLGFPPALEHNAVFATLAVATVAVEAFLTFALLVPRLRPAALVVGLGFHAAIVLTVNRWSPYAVIGFTVFAVEMFALYLICLDPAPRSLRVAWDQDCPSCARTVRRWRRLDWLGALALTPTAATADGPGVEVGEGDGRSTGFRAWRRVLEVLPVSFLWAPGLALPPVEWLGEALVRRPRHRHGRPSPVPSAPGPA